MDGNLNCICANAVLMCNFSFAAAFGNAVAKAACALAVPIAASALAEGLEYSGSVRYLDKGAIAASAPVAPND